LADVVDDPIFSAIGFLNEIMTRYPDAISFAPGAPYLDGLDRAVLSDALDAFLKHSCEVEGLSPTAAWKRIIEYGPSKGIVNSLLARSLRDDYGIQATADDVVVTVGAQEAFLLILRCLFNPAKDQLAYVVPCFPGIRGAAAFLGINTVAIPENPAGPDLGVLREACATARAAGQRIAALYVAPDFSNPSGTIMSARARAELLELAAEEELLLLEDSTYGFSASEVGSVPPSLKARDTGGMVVQIGTLSKLCFPGARVGFVVAEQMARSATGGARRLAESLATLKNMTTVNTSPLAQAVAAGLLLRAGGSLAVRGMIQNGHYVRSRAALLDALDRHLPDAAELGISWTRPTGGFFLVVDAPIVLDHAALAACATEYGVLWTPMSDFYPDGGGSRSLRLSYSYLTQTQIDEGATRLARFLRTRLLASPTTEGTR
jgi:(S)-3,5-dihydroxyphenylglycine transaminase